jgi:hypothetical protein
MIYTSTENHYYNTNYHTTTMFLARYTHTAYVFRVDYTIPNTDIYVCLLALDHY